MAAHLATLLGILTVGLLSPGPDFFLIVRNSMSGSRARAFATGWGIAVGLAAQVIALSLGLAVLPPLVLRGIQLAGAAVLAWLGLKALLSRAGPVPLVAPDEISAEKDFAVRRKRERGQWTTGFVEGFLCNVTNAKAFVFFVSLFSQFIPARSSWGWRALVPLLVVAHGAFMWSLINWALMFPPVARQLARAQRWLPRAFGVVLIGFALLVAWESTR